MVSSRRASTLKARGISSAAVQRGKYSEPFLENFSTFGRHFVYDPAMIGYCPASLKFTPALLRASFGRVPVSSWDVPTGPERFTPREVIHHLAFWEPVARWRMEQALALDGVEVPDWDEDQHALDFNYGSLDPLPALALFAVEREKTMALFESLEQAEWSRTFTHPVKGTLTLYAWAATMLGHDLYHLAQLEESAG